MTNKTKQSNMAFTELMKFAAWETDRLNKASKQTTNNERILWAAGKVAEETGEIWSDVLTLVGLARIEKIENFKKEDLAAEIADVILTTSILAHRLGIDLADVVQKKIVKVKSRDYKDFYDPDPLGPK